MNQHNISKTPELPVKRKRGRPRKDESMPRNIRQHTQPPLVMVAPTSSPPVFLTTIHPPPPTTTPGAMITTIQPQPQPQPPANVITFSSNASKPATTPTVITSSSNVNKIDPNMVGQAVTCVIDGIFDNGYLLSTRLGSNNTILRGIVFQQGRVVPVTPANDVAPHIEMCTRGEFPIPPSNPTKSSMQVCSPEAVCAKQLPIQPVAMQNVPGIVAGASISSAPQESLRLVEQDDVMQVFEVSKTVEEPQSCDQIAKNKQMISNDPTVESFTETDTDTIIQGVQPLDKANENEPILNTGPNDQQHAKEPVEGIPELITPAETIVDNQPSMADDGLQQEIQDQTGAESNNDANQDPNQVAVDISLNNFTEN